MSDTLQFANPWQPSARPQHTPTERPPGMGLQDRRQSGVEPKSPAQSSPVARPRQVSILRLSDLPVLQAPTPHNPEPPTRERVVSIASRESQSPRRQQSRVGRMLSINSVHGVTTPRFGSSPGINLDPNRTDYFQGVTRKRTSYRAASHLAAVVVGRTLISFGAASLSRGFVPIHVVGPGLAPAAPPDGVDGDTVSHLVALGISLTTLGAVSGTGGTIMFIRDTYRLSPRRSAFIGSIALLGFYSVIASTLVYVYGQAQNDIRIRYLSLLPRIVGEFCLFYAITNSYPSSELVHGNTPLKYRDQTRLCSFALGGAMIVTWGILSNSGQNAPIWAREVCRTAGIAGLHLGSSLARTDALRSQSHVRSLRSPDPTSRDRNPSYP